MRNVLVHDYAGVNIGRVWALQLKIFLFCERPLTNICKLTPQSHAFLLNLSRYCSNRKQFVATVSQLACRRCAPIQLSLVLEEEKC